MARRRIRVRGKQRDEINLERLAHALLRAAREAMQAEAKRPPENSAEAQHDA